MKTDKRWKIKFRSRFRSRLYKGLKSLLVVQAPTKKLAVTRAKQWVRETHGDLIWVIDKVVKLGWKIPRPQPPVMGDQSGGSEGGAHVRAPLQAKAATDPQDSDSDIEYSVSGYGWWTGVNEELPRLLEDVLVAHGDQKNDLTRDFGWRSASGNWYRHRDINPLRNVCYWQPVPPLPFSSSEDGGHS